MNKLELINVLSERANISKADSKTIVSLFFDTMSDALKNDGRVEIRGFCSFYLKEYKSYLGRNPKSGEKIMIEPKKLPFFKCGKELKDRVDYEK